VGDVKFGPKFLPMKFLGINVIECGIVNIERRRGEFCTSKNGTAVNIVQKMIVVIQLVGETPIVVEDIARLFPRTTCGFRSYADRTWSMCAILSVSGKAMRPEFVRELNVKYNK
jgi:hypothetical protein